MELQIDLGLEFDDSTAKMERVKEAQTKKKASAYEPTWSEVWYTGYPTASGKHKAGIFQTKISSQKDMDRLLEVKQAIESDELAIGVESLKKFSKSHALNLYKVLLGEKRAKIAKKYITEMPDNYKLVNTDSALLKVTNALNMAIANGEIIALDTETTGLEFTDVTVGISLSFESDVHYYIPYGHITPVRQLHKAEVMYKLMPWLQSKRAKLILHNSKFDAHMLLKDGIDIREQIWGDTKIIQHILNENEESYALKKIADKYGQFFNYHDKSYTFEELFGKDPINFIKADIKLATYYACKDTHLTMLLFKWQLSQMEKQPNLYSTYFDIEQKITPVCIDMEDVGFEVDFSFADQYKVELQHQVEALGKTIALTMGDININSSQQLGAFIYSDPVVKDFIEGKKEFEKQSADAKTLKKLSKVMPILKTLLEYRELKKLLSTYIEPLPQKVRHDTKRLTGEFIQDSTVTGRFSSKNPNLQNLPQKARHLFKAPKGKVIIGIDYSQIEPRTLASMSEDKGLRLPYETGVDLYATLASNTFGLPYEACLESDAETYKETGLPKHPRKMMKVGLLASMYGIAVPSLAESLGITVPEAQKFMDDFYKAYPRMVEWMDEVVKTAEQQGYVNTMFGRKRRFIGFQAVAKEYHAVTAKIEARLGRKLTADDFIWDKKLKLPYHLKQAYWNVAREYSRVARQSVNAIIQGSASEIMKIAMIKARAFLKNKPEWLMLATIHDELLFEIPETATEKEIRELEAVMAEAVTLEVPIKCDVEVAKVWGKGVPLAQWVQEGNSAFE